MPRWTTDRAFAAFGDRSSTPVLAAVDRLTGIVMARGGQVAPGTGSVPSIMGRVPFGKKSVMFVKLDQQPDGEVWLFFPLAIHVNAGMSTESMARFVERVCQVPAIDRIPQAAKKFQVEGLRRANFRKWPGFVLDDVLAQPDGSEALADIGAALEEYIQFAQEAARTASGA